MTVDNPMSAKMKREAIFENERLIPKVLAHLSPLVSSLRRLLSFYH